ncbi:palmitoyltransferase ZDHHC18 isoform X2 [Anoplophora glabripennis]|uniref:palmitoyltransferase ZDHHC18 isoform X2 n=1 Tax=Anoplophora glabripennis TaxID=217634 RepID=UPI0008753997|nr:palmitoyltransferase ZDHHC18 isoform X2 [Anoplophora glabripennis]
MTVDLDYQLIDLWTLQSESNDSDSEMAQERVTRKWEVFQGRNRFYCNGRLMTAPNSGVFLLTVFLITVTSTLFFIFDCSYLAENVTIAIPIIGALLFLFTMSSLLRTSLSDPGIIPRATAEEAAYVEKQIEVTNSANSPTYRPPPRTKEVLVKGQTIKLKYCFTCKIFRPPRASHCSLCDNCVDRFDHHCPWVGNCVGRRNYRFFYMFIVSLAFLAVFIFACAVAHLILITRDDRQFLEAVKESPASVIVAIICFFSVWSILGLAGFHTYLTTSNQTTNEDIKGSFTSKRGQESFNPYSQGNVCLNCFHILCGPVTPSLIDRRGLVTDSYRSEINRSSSNEPTLQLKNYGIHVQNGPQQVTNNSSEMPGIYRQTTETAESNAGSITHLVTSEQPLAIAPAVQLSRTLEDSQQYKSQPSLNHSPVYNNIVRHTNQVPLGKSHSYADNLNTTVDKQVELKETTVNIEDLHLDPIVLRESHILSNISENTKFPDLKLDNDLTLQEKENSLLSASRLRLLQDTTMIESALDLDSLDDSSLGTNSQAGLMKIVV